MKKIDVDRSRLGTRAFYQFGQWHRSGRRISQHHSTLATSYPLKNEKQQHVECLTRTVEVLPSQSEHLTNEKSAKLRSYADMTKDRGSDPHFGIVVTEGVVKGFMAHGSNARNK